MFPDRKPLWREDPQLVFTPTWCSLVLIGAGIWIGWWFVWAVGALMLAVLAVLVVLDVVVTRRGNKVRAELRELVAKMQDGAL